MIINNPDALKSWLTQILEPLCDADPSALARYVFALLKKDKPIKELKKGMTEQLDVFLGSETKPFLERLFSAISSETYLNVSIICPTDTEVAGKSISKSPERIITRPIKNEKECTPPLNDNKAKESLTNEILENNHSSTGLQINSTIATTTIVSPESTTISISPVKATSDKENQPREARRRRISVRSRSRSRSRSLDRTRRSRSRERRTADRDKISRQFRNKSPTTNRDVRRSDRRGGDRSPRAICKGRTKSHSASRSRSTSPERRKISRSSSPSTVAADNNIAAKRQRCRDFDEKGYCVRGETCLWDHGVNPVVLEGISNTTLISMPAHLREYNPDAPEIWNRPNTFTSGPRTAFPHKVGGGVPGTYPRPPNVSFRAIGPPFPFPVNSTAVTPVQRELISVPVVDGNSGSDSGNTIQAKRRYEQDDSMTVTEGSTKRKLPINSRLGPRLGTQQNCSLELRKIPRGMNTISHLNNHFSKFGKIVNIQITYDGDPEAAIVTFSTHAEANVAYRSTEAVLNNRFIKVFWHSPGNPPDVLSSAKEEVILNGRKHSQYHLNNITSSSNPSVDGGIKPCVTLPSGSISLSLALSSTSTSTISTTSTAVTTVISSSSTTSSTTTVQSPSSLRIKNSRHVATGTTAIIRKKQEEQVKAAVQLAHGLHKRKHELLQEYLKQMKSAVELVERVEHSDPQRAKMLDTIKELQGSIDKLRKEIATEQAQIAAQIQNQPSAKKSKEQQKKELLDIELELIAQQQEGNDTTAIQKRLEELQKSLGISNKPPFAARANRLRSVAPPGSTSVDRRPTALAITGFASEDSDILLGHFKHFGEITNHEIDRSIPQLILSYATRGNAEQAVIRGRIFKDKRLTIGWASTIKTTFTGGAAGATGINNNNIQSRSHKMDTLEKVDFNSASFPELRLEDEEEEEDAESEDRSWRR